MAIDLKLKMSLDEQGAVARYLSESGRTNFSIGLMSLDKDFKFNDGAFKFEQEGIGKLEINIKDNDLNSFLITIHHKTNANLCLKIGGEIIAKGFKIDTINPKIEFQIHDIIVEGIVSGNSLKDKIEHFDGEFKITQGKASLQVTVDGERIAEVNGNLEFKF